MLYLVCVCVSVFLLCYYTHTNDSRWAIPNHTATARLLSSPWTRNELGRPDPDTETLYGEGGADAVVYTAAFFICDRMGQTVRHSTNVRRHHKNFENRLLEIFDVLVQSGHVDVALHVWVTLTLTHRNARLSVVWICVAPHRLVAVSGVRFVTRSISIKGVQAI